MKNIITLSGIFVLFSLSFCFAREQTSESLQKDLNKIKSEIQEIEAKIKEEEKKEASTDRSIQNIGRQIYLRRQMIKKISSAEKQTERKIDLAEKDISAREKEISSLREVAKKRIVHLYKYGRTNEIEAIVSSKSFSQALIRIKYVMYFIENDKKNINRLATEVQELEKERNTLLDDLAYKRNITAKKRSESASLSRKQQVLKREKSAIQKNQKALLSELRKKEASVNKLMELIAQANRASRDKPAIAFMPVGTPFAKLRGKLIWPANGRIISHFGLNYNNKLKTRIDNRGIDIKAVGGSDVYSVWHGRVFTITWLPGFGPVLIIEHDNRYLTVYAHLSEILIGLEETVSPGQIIGRVGDAESYDGPKLNFQIWKDGQNLNPEQWLSKR